MKDEGSAARIRAVARALPPHRLGRDDGIALLRRVWADHPEVLERLPALRRSIQVEERHLALAPDEYAVLPGFAARNDAWRRVAAALGEQAVRAALDRAGLPAEDVRHFLFASSTGISVPPVDVGIATRVGMGPRLARSPLFGLGCGAGAAGIARAAEWLEGQPSGATAVLLSVELCSLTFQRDDVSLANVIAAMLFGDGAAAVVLRREPRSAPGPRVLGAASILHEGTEHMAGWTIGDGGFGLVLAPEIPAFWRAHIREDVDGFLAGHGLHRDRIDHWVVHTGGPKILQAFEAALELPQNAIERSWNALRHTGNLSSASVLFALGDLLDGATPREGDLGLLLAMGPGLSAEAVLLGW